MDLFSLFGASEKPKEQLEPSPDEVFSNGTSDDFSDDSFDTGEEIDTEDAEEALDVPVAATSYSEPPVEPEPVLAPVDTPTAPVVKAENSTPTKEPATMSDLKSEILNLSDAEFAALLKAREEKKKEALKGEKLETIQKLLVNAAYDDLAKVEAFVRGGFKIKTSSEAIVSTVSSSSDTATRKRFELKSEHTVDNLVSVLEKGKPYKVSELLKSVGIVEGMDLNGAAGFDSYVTKYKTTVLAEAKTIGKIITKGEKVSTEYFVV